MFDATICPLFFGPAVVSCDWEVVAAFAVFELTLGPLFLYLYIKETRKAAGLK